MVVIEESDVLAFDIPIQQLHHVDHFFRRVFSTDHHVDAFEISLPLEVLAITVDRCHQNKCGDCGHDNAAPSDTASVCIGSDCSHDVHGKKFFAVATILDVGVPPHNVGRLMGDDCTRLGSIIDEDKHESYSQAAP